jgi:hypothetical protein
MSSDMPINREARLDSGSDDDGSALAASENLSNASLCLASETDALDRSTLSLPVHRDISCALHTVHASANISATIFFISARPVFSDTTYLKGNCLGQGMVAGFAPC